MKFSSLLVAALGLVGVVAAPTTFSNLHGDDRRAAIIADVNSKATTWVAGHHERFAGKPFHAIKRQLGVLDIAASEADKLPLEIHTGFDMFGLPEEFDPREAWPQCKTIREVRDQSDCGSCWAFGAVEAASDRVCIATGGKFQPHLSAQDMLACCSSCGMGCNGGYPSAAWSYLKNTGVVTGGNYNDKSWCSAYSMPNCDHHTTGQYEPCGSHDYPTPACPKQCDADSTYTTPFAQDKIRFNSSYSVSRDPTQIMQELMTRGPVEAAFSVYDDFPSYKSGVYQHVSGSYLGGHAIKLLGWGVDKATGAPYWLCANSWNEDWGEQGFFRILRGSNHCGIESGIVAGQFSA